VYVSLSVVLGYETSSLTLRAGHGLRVFENRVLRKFCLPKGEEVGGDWRTPHNMIFGEASSPYEGKGVCLQVFSGELKERENLEYLSVDREIILNCFLSISDGRM
jgi:hypothetical protein